MIVKNHIIPSLPLRTKEFCIPVEGLRKDSLWLLLLQALQRAIVEETGINDYYWSSLTSAQ